MAAHFHNIIGGEDVPSSSGDWIEVRNPADTDEVLGLVPASTTADASWPWRT